MTIKQQLIPLRIGKGLLSLVALFVMLLAPQRAWAQADYGLTVAGVAVTSDNATNIIGQNILAGTVTYEDGSHTLTLDHATINGSVVVTGGFDLVVCLVGDNTIQGTGETSLANGISRGGGSAAGKLTFDIAKNTSGSLFFPYVTTPIAGFANIEYQNGLEWGCRDEGTTTDYVEGVGTEVVLASIGASLYVTKTKTTMTLSDNGGTVTYRKDDTLGRHVLTLSGLTDLNNCISWYSPDDVTIEISGTNNSMSFSSSDTYNSVCFEGKPQSNISFRFTGATATLKMYDRSQYKSLEHPWISGFGNASNPTLSDGLKMVEIDEYRYDSQDNQTNHVERYITTETYGLNVKGIQVHNLEGVNVGHKDHILGLTYNAQTGKREYDTSITFNSSDSGNILTLNNATISYTTGNAIVSSITTPLTVYLTGENSISSGSYLPFEGEIGDNANLVFTTNTTGTPGSLTMTSTYTGFGPTQFFDGFKQILYPEEQGSLSAKSVDGNVVISQEAGYGLKVAGIMVTKDNASHILGENNTTVTFTPATAATDTEPAKPATLTLNNATISGIIETSIDLTVDFKGSSTIILPTDKEYPFVGNNSPVLSFTNSGKNSNPLTVNGEFNGGNTKFMNGFAQESVDVDINEDRDNATVWWLESTVSAYMYLRWIEKYDLWIGETQFTNLDLELSGGKASFDGDHTLTLNGASLTAPIKSNLDNLTIKLKGNNSIVETSDSATLINSYKKTATLSFDVDNELGGSLTLTNRGDGATIKNFTSVSLAEGLYIHSNQAGLRYETINNEKCYVAQQYGESWTMTINQNASYPIWVYKNSTDGYVQITGTNKDNVLGEQTDTKSVTYNDGTLTLNGATINSGTNYAFVMGDNMTALNVVLVGVNTVTGNGFQFTTSPASLKFKTNGTDAGSLAIVDAQNTNYSLATTTVEGENVTTAYENGLVYNSTNKTVSVVSYGLTVAGTAVTNANMGNVLGDGTVSFALAQDATETTPATPATLTLNGADISEYSISYSGAEDLTIAIKDNNQVFSINYNGNENDIPELTITKASGATNCSLALNSKGEGCVISGFSALNYGTFNTISSAPISYGKIDPAENYVCIFDALTKEMMSDVTFTTATTYPLWVAGNQVTGVNADDLFDDGGNEQTPTVSFTPATTTPATPATLTLNGVNYSPEDGDVTPLVVSSLDNLTVKLAGSNSVYVSSQAEVFPEAAFVSTNSDAVLTFTTNESTNLQLLNTNTIELASGFSSIAFTGYLYRDQNMVKNLLAPTPSMDDNYLQIGRAGYEPDATTFNYVIEYEDESQSVNGTYDMSKTASENNIVLDKPCTVTVFAQYGTLKSAEKVGKLFGFAQNEVSGLPGSMVDIPAIVPTIINSDGIEIGHEGVDVNETITKIDLTEASYGKTILYLYFTAGETTPYVILNKSAELRVNVIPAAPTIAFDGTKTYLNSDKVTISLPTSLAGDQNAVIVYSWDGQLGNANNYTDDGVTLNAGTNTLYAWVRYNGQTTDDAVYSERVSQVFTVKTDINQFAVKDMIATDSTYTGSAIEPTFTLYDAKEPTNTLSAENYDVRIEKYVDETTGYSVVTSVLDAGTYKVYAVGKGDTYGGEKLIYEALVVNKANIQGLPTVAANDLVYDGTEQVLLPITVPDGVTVEYFFASITEEDYKGSYDLNCAGEVSYSTTIPKATNAGYFAIIYKVDGGNNYNNVRPSGTIKVAIYPAEITELTIATNSLTYTGEAQTVTITSVKAGELVLTTSDYDVSYEVVEEQGASPVDAPVETGTYNAVVTGKGNFTGTQSAKFTVLKDPEFCFYVGEKISNGATESYIYGEEQTLTELKRWDNGYLIDPTGFTITYTSSDQNVATIDNTGKITIKGVGLTEIRASIEATEEYAADEAWFTMKVVPAVPKVSIPDGAYFTGQELSITTDAQGGDLYYSYGYEKVESNRTRYAGVISLPAGEYEFYPYTRCGTVDNPIWSYTEATELYVYDEPTISKNAGEYEGDIEVEITDLPKSDKVSVTAYYYLGDDDGDEKNDILYTAGDKITVSESTKLNVYLLVEGDSGKKYKTKVIEREYTIKDIPLDVTATDFHNHWMTYYHNNNGNVGLPESQNIGAYVATSISGNEIVVTQIKSIPRGEPVLLNDETTTTTTNVFGQDVQGNLLVHATDDVDVAEKAGEGDFYGLYNGAFMRVTGTIPAGKNYLMVPNAVVPSGYAPQLTIVIDGEATGVNDVRSKMEDVRGDIYDLQGRKVQKPSKKGLYINNGHKVVVK